MTTTIMKMMRSVLLSSLVLLAASAATSTSSSRGAAAASAGSYDYPTADPPPQPGGKTTTTTSSSEECKTCPWNRPEMGQYPTPFNAKDKKYEPIHRGDYFDVYGHWIESRYSEVFWTAQPAIPLPPAIVKEFKGRPISFTGFEVDVVAGGEVGGEEEEWSVPEFQVYNHHYCASITGEGTKMVKVGVRGQDSLLHSSLEDEFGIASRENRHAIEIHPPEWEPRDVVSSQAPPINSSIPTAQNFWQGNGGEHRKSFKHLPAGSGQLLWSPKQFVLQPMLINTNFPPSHPNQSPREAFWNATQPKSSLAPPQANYSGLLECPCTTRTQKIITGYETKTKDTCAAAIDANGKNGTLQTPTECFTAAQQLMGGTILRNTTLADKRYPTGCYLVASTKGTEAFFNTQADSKARCGSHDGVPIRSIGQAGNTNGNGKIGIHLDLNQATNTATVTLTGPANSWYAIGFDAARMADTPYTIVVEGKDGPNDNATVTERTLGNHMPGTPLDSSVTIVSDTVGPPPPPQPLKSNYLGKLIGKEVKGVNSWQSCQHLCQQNYATAKGGCRAWTILPKRFTTPYNIEDGTCQLKQLYHHDEEGSATTTTPQDGFTSNGWMDGMWSGLLSTSNFGDNDDGNGPSLVRTVVLTRSLKGKTANHYTFDPAISSLPYIEAVGTPDSANFGYHGPKGRSGGSIVMVQTGAPVCVCRGKKLSGSINGIPWADNCMDYPATTIKRDHNPSCSIETYGGGMICCHHGIFLLDAEQEIPAPTFRFRMKFRFYYEDPEKVVAQAKEGGAPPTISQLVYPGLDYQNAFFMFRETEMAHGEYDVPACDLTKTAPEDCVHVVVGHFQTKDAVKKCKGRADVWCSPVAVPNATFPQSQHVALVHISAHCHGPACISMEMINSDTNETICYTEPHYGTSLETPMDEAGYAAGIPPCLWGTPQEGLPFPPILHLQTNLTVIKKVNSTVGHRGVMGHWQMRGIWAADPKENAMGQTNDEEISTR